MRTRLSSRERLLTTMEHEEPDHVPLYVKWWERQFPERPEDGWHSQYERIEYNLRQGLDQGVELPDLRWTSWIRPEVETRLWREKVPGADYPILHKEYDTPRGTLHQAMRQTTGWRGRSMYNYFDVDDDVPLTGNTLINRSTRFLVETMEDAEALDGLFRTIDDKEREAFFQEAEKARRYAERHELLLEGGAFSTIGGDALAWFCGIEKTILNAHRRPEVVRRVLQTVHKHDMEALQLFLEAGGVDMVFHEGWYENGHFWSPTLFREFLAPLIREEVALAHNHGVKYCHIVTTGLRSLLGLLMDLGVDLIFGIDPVQGNVDLQRAKEDVGDRVCLWGGVNGAVTLGFGPQSKIQKETRDAISLLASGGGFILAPIDQLWPYTPWPNVRCMVDTWRKRSSYTVHSP